VTKEDRYKFTIYNGDGDFAQHGDKIIVELPERHLSYHHDDDGIYISGKTVLAEIRLRLSMGLIIKVLEILSEIDEDDDRPLSVGDIRQFRRKSWKWRRAS